MFKLDNDFLIELGLGALPADDKNKMLAHIYETLEMRVGMKLAEQMSDAQLDEFEGFINRNDEAGALTWLETNFPNYKQVVAEELERLKNEIRQVSPQIVSDSMAAQAQGAQIQPGQLPGSAAAPAQPGQMGQMGQGQMGPQDYQQPPMTQQTVQQQMPQQSPVQPQPFQPAGAQSYQMSPQYQQPQVPQPSYQQSSYPPAPMNSNDFGAPSMGDSGAQQSMQSTQQPYGQNYQQPAAGQPFAQQPSMPQSSTQPPLGPQPPMPPVYEQPFQGYAQGGQTQDQPKDTTSNDNSTPSNDSVN